VALKTRIGRPPPLRPELLPPARALAERVLADEIPSVRRSRRAGKASLAIWAAYAGFAIFIEVTGYGGDRPLSALFGFYAILGGSGAFTVAVLSPRRMRRNAERLLAGVARAGRRRPRRRAFLGTGRLPEVARSPPGGRPPRVL
jgi:hypothetical protein